MSETDDLDKKAVPFFARFLEGQHIVEMSEEESETIGGGREGEDMEIVTLKYPSDDEDGGVMTRKFPSDNEDGGGRPVTEKFPSDWEDGNGGNRRRQLIRRWLRRRRRGDGQDDGE